MTPGDIRQIMATRRAWRRGGLPPVAIPLPDPLHPDFELVLNATAAEAARLGATITEIRAGITAGYLPTKGGQR